MDEIWVDVKGYEGLYQVSNHGRVRSMDRLIPKSVGIGYRLMKGKILRSAAYHNPGYPRICLSKSGKVRWVSIHSLVLVCFVGDRPNGMECRHLDGDRMNPRLNNLRWGTPSQNQRDREQHGTGNQGNRNRASKVDEETVVVIKKMSKEKSRGEIAHRLGLSYCIVSDVIAGRTWRHVPCGSA